MPRPELWGGIESTVNRVGDEYLDQIELSGHGHRMEDLERFAALGLRTLRYPVLWERTAAHHPALCAWEWPDQRLQRLKSLGIAPVVGLLHHGSGPRYTSLVDPAFPEGFADFAGRVARRYPWVTAYTPINEPLTTARFSGLYGHWHPHGRDDRTFVRALLNQCRGTILAMLSIREVNDAARLVQTEDLGRIYSTVPLKHQAEFENDRRWLTWDLLSGRVDAHHPLYGYLQSRGASESELLFFVDDPCPPDLLGVNYYVTSDRFLDHRLQRYPPDTHGGNGRESYADVEAVRVSAGGISGHASLLREAWERYRLPIALTELHLGCTRGDQLRWFLEGWRAACQLSYEGVDVRAVTAWSLLGAHGWSGLLTSGEGGYEPGVFDITGPRPRETALAGMIRVITAGREPAHPVLDTPGWWRRSERCCYPRSRSAQLPRSSASESAPPRTSDPRHILITGATGTLGQAFSRICEQRGLVYRITTRAELDITDPQSVADLLRAPPWAVVNTAGFVRVDDAEVEWQRCLRENTEGPENLASVCARLGIPFVTFSSDLVFDGRSGRPYLEPDQPNPLGVYGASKAEAERRVLSTHPAALVVRTSAFFGPWDAHNFITRGLDAIAAGEQWFVDSDDVVSPTYVPDLVNASLDLLIDGERGIWHLANAGAVSWQEFAEMALRFAGIPTGGLVQRRGETNRAGRPAYSVLGSVRGGLLPPLHHALERYLSARPPPLRQEGRRDGAADSGVVRVETTMPLTS